VSKLKDSAQAGVKGGAVGAPPFFFWQNQDWLASFDYLSITIALTLSACSVAIVLLTLGYMSLHRKLRALEEQGGHPFLSDHHG